MDAALDEYVVRGLKHNVCLLRDVINQPDYRKGNITTNYLPQHYPHGFVKAELEPAAKTRMVVATAAMKLIRAVLAAVRSAIMSPRRLPVSGISTGWVLP